MKTLKLLAFAFATCMFACNSPEKETVKPIQEASSERVTSTSSDPFPCSITSTTQIGGDAAIAAINNGIGCRQPACLNTAQIYAKVKVFTYTPANWTSDTFDQPTMQGYSNSANSAAAALVSQVQCNNSSNSVIYIIKFDYEGGFGSPKSIVAYAEYRCCDGNVVYPQ